MNSRRLIAFPQRLRTRRSYSVKQADWKGENATKTHVRFGSQADICGAIAHVRFTPNSDHERGHVPIVMSALPPKADMCSALAYVCFGPIADINYSITVSSWVSNHHVPRRRNHIR